MDPVRLEQAGDSWRVLHSDGTVLYEGTETEAKVRLASFRELVDQWPESTGEQLLKVYPSNATGPLVFAAVNNVRMLDTATTHTFDEESGTYTFSDWVIMGPRALKRTASGWVVLEFTQADLAQVVEAFSDLKWEPVLKVTHSKEQPLIKRLSALGTVTALRVEEVGGAPALLATVSRVPKDLGDLMLSGALPQRSVELWSNVPRMSGKGTHPRALKAVSLLGSDLPAIPGMPPNHESKRLGAEDVRTVVTETKHQEKATMSEPDNKPDPKVDVERLAKLEEGMAQFKVELAGKDDKIAALEAALEAEKAVSRAKAAVFDVDRWVKDGKITPAEKDRVAALYKALPDTEVVKFGAEDGSKASLRDEFAAMIEAREKHPAAPGNAETKGDHDEKPANFASMDDEEQSNYLAELEAKLVKEKKVPEGEDPSLYAARIAEQGGE